MIKVLGLALYGPLAASTRYRLEQYVPGLANFGIDLQVRYLLDNDYLQRRFNGQALSITHLLQRGWARFGDLWRQAQYDLSIVHCELFPLLPGWIERALIRKPYIYDFDDAFYLRYRKHRLPIVRLLGDKFDKVIQGAAAVSAGNQVLSRYAQQYNPHTYYLPTVVDTERYVPRRSHNTVFTVGWIGSPSTGSYLSQLIAPLSQFAQQSPLRFIVIGSKAPVIPQAEVVEIPWQEETEIELINSFDVGVMPLPDDEWAQGKCAFKLIQYMACGVPVIASPVGANLHVVNEQCGFLAATVQEWLDALRVLRDQPSTRAAMGQAARARVLEHFSLHCNLPRFAHIMHSAAQA